MMEINTTISINFIKGEKASEAEFEFKKLIEWQEDYEDEYCNYNEYSPLVVVRAARVVCYKYKVFMGLSMTVDNVGGDFIYYINQHADVISFASPYSMYDYEEMEISNDFLVNNRNLINFDDATKNLWEERYKTTDFYGKETHKLYELAVEIEVISKIKSYIIKSNWEDYNNSKNMGNDPKLAVKTSCEALQHFIGKLGLLIRSETRFYPNTELGDGLEKILSAVAHHNLVDCIDSLIELGADPNYMVQVNMTYIPLLNLLIGQNKIEVARRLVEKGALGINPYSGLNKVKEMAEIQKDSITDEDYKWILSLLNVDSRNQFKQSNIKIARRTAKEIYDEVNEVNDPKLQSVITELNVAVNKQKEIDDEIERNTPRTFKEVFSLYSEKSRKEFLDLMNADGGNRTDDSPVDWARINAMSADDCVPKNSVDESEEDFDSTESYNDDSDYELDDLEEDTDYDFDTDYDIDADDDFDDQEYNYDYDTEEEDVIRPDVHRYIDEDGEEVIEIVHKLYATVEINPNDVQVTIERSKPKTIDTNNVNEQQNRINNSINSASKITENVPTNRLEQRLENINKIEPKGYSTKSVEPTQQTYPKATAKQSVYTKPEPAVQKLMIMFCIIGAIVLVLLVKSCIFTEGSKFEYKEVDSNSITITSYNEECRDWRDIIIPETIKGKTVVSIKNGAFYYCKINKLSIPGTVKEFGGAFSSSEIQDIIINEGVKLIDVSAFSKTVFHGQVVLPSTVKTINPNAFLKTEFKKGIVLNEGLELIREYSFKESKLKEVKIPSTTVSIEQSAFYTANLEGLTFATNSKLKSIELEAFYGNNLGEVMLPNSIKTISTLSFASSNITKLSLPMEVELIRFNAFTSNKLTEVTLPNSNATIQGCVFANNKISMVYNLHIGIKYLTSTFQNNTELFENYPSINDNAQSDNANCRW